MPTETTVNTRKNTSIYIVSLFYISIGVFIYFQTLSIIFLSDDYNFLFRFKQHGISSFFDNCKDSFFIPLSHFLTYLEYKIFGLNSIGHHLVSLALHIANSILIFTIVLKTIKEKAQYNNSIMLAFFSGAFFLLNPYQTEAVNWLTAKSYLLSLFFMLLALLFYVDYKQLKRTRELLLSLIFFMLGLLSKEMSIVFPLLIIAFELIGITKSNYKKKETYFGTLKIAGVYLLALLVYFSFRYAVIGGIVGGYGKEIHTNFNFNLLLFNCIAYVAKFFLFYRFIPDALKEFVKLHSHLALGISFILAFGLCFSVYKQSIQNRINTAPHFRHGMLILCCFFISLIPVINLETSFLGEIQSDRYGYFASVFFSFFIAYIIIVLLPKKFSFPILTLIALLFSYITYKQNLIWCKAGSIAENTLSSLSKFETNNKLVFVLNTPDSYKGAYIFRCGLDDAVNLMYPTKKDTIIILAYQAIANTSDNALITINHSIEVNAVNKNYFWHSNYDRFPEAITYLKKLRNSYKLSISDSFVSDSKNIFLYCDANGICHPLY